ncbi:uncharacterized protein LOC126758985 [Bactrocera neohumeralis]|uniref:Uncharacterized protein LOC105224978 n=1 Tax=Bactrocera dorsalis TaxID=27457 RepID=A0A034WSJ3_BACDO|nr:uncharacterized protein LOC105224978 [Bactrocera dorsalis]XP_050329459.1 uncharacterized protein LOC126758985 [Bactrocera neohumeralis]
MYKCRPTGEWMSYDANIPTPKSVTHEMLEAGRKATSNIRIIARKQLNFQSYPMNDFRFDLLHFDKPKEFQSVSTYKRDYVEPLPSKCKPKNVHDVESPDPLFNRRTVNDFEMVPWVDTKFMDDKVFNISESRRKINFFRQLRNRSFQF